MTEALGSDSFESLLWYVTKFGGFYSRGRSLCLALVAVPGLRQPPLGVVLINSTPRTRQPGLQQGFRLLPSEGWKDVSSPRPALVKGGEAVSKDRSFICSSLYLLRLEENKGADAKRMAKQLSAHTHWPLSWRPDFPRNGGLLS